jgi:chaperone modulatory protein CbpM
MIDRQQFLVRTRLEIETLEVWIKEEWLIPREDAAGQEFSDADIARTHLIKNLKQDFGVNSRGWCRAVSALPLRHRITRSSAWVTRRVPRLCSRPSFFHPSIKPAHVPCSKAQEASRSG